MEKRGFDWREHAEEVKDLDLRTEPREIRVTKEEYEKIRRMALDPFHKENETAEEKARREKKTAEARAAAFAAMTRHIGMAWQTWSEADLEFVENKPQPTEEQELDAPTPFIAGYPEQA